MNNLAINEKMFDTIIGIQSLDNSCINKGKEIFEQYKKKNIIIDSLFSDMRWQFSDEYSNVGIRFNFNEVSYNQHYKKLFHISYSAFCDYAKTFVMFTMGKIVLNTLRDTVNDMKRMVGIAPEEIDMGTLFITNPNRLLEFLSMLPISEVGNDEMERFMDKIDTLSELQYFDNIQKRRPLASFDSYFLFNDIINDYWASNLDLDTRLFYYPLFLWWQITAVIPLRPREFILTPRNCLEEKPDGTYITLRRNKLKGGNGKVSYLIDDDYIKVQYKIPDKLACIIKEYIQLTSSFAPTELETLFISDTHYKHWGQSKHKNSRYFTYINMHCVLRYFFYEVIQGKYHLKVIHDRNTAHLNEGEINFLYLGDTRHLALINIIAEGGTPVLAMMLAGHENIEMSAHYYTNITHLIECRTYKQYRKVLKGNVSYNISPAITLPDTIKNGKILEDGGMCYSDSYAKGNVSDCIKAVGKNGEIGYCLDCSFYFQKGSERFLDDDGKYKRKIEDDCNFLKEMIRQVRLGITDKEDIIQALNRLHSSSVTYQQYYEQKAKFIDEKGNKIWAERRS